MPLKINWNMPLKSTMIPRCRFLVCSPLPLDLASRRTSELGVATARDDARHADERVVRLVQPGPAASGVGGATSDRTRSDQIGSDQPSPARPSHTYESNGLTATEARADQKNPHMRTPSQAIAHEPSSTHRQLPCRNGSGDDSHGNPSRAAVPGRSSSPCYTPLGSPLYSGRKARAGAGAPSAAQGAGASPWSPNISCHEIRHCLRLASRREALLPRIHVSSADRFRGRI